MAIEIKNLCKNFGDSAVFIDYSICIPDGVCALMAGSGIGKTTLLRILAGLDRSYTGSIEGVGSISYCPQNVALFPWYSAKKNLKIVLKDTPDADRLIDEGLDAFGLSDSADKKPAQMSGGMCQRVAILRAWLYPSDTVILDEPFKGLDDATKRQVIDYLKKTRRSGRNVIFSTHSSEEAETFADHIIKF
jgi:NitT/TauT family transport system ATP-binding protein